jgi:hypothetical protein
LVDELDPVADGVVGMQPAPSGDLSRVDPDDLAPGGGQRARDLVEVDQEGRVGFAAGRKSACTPACSSPPPGTWNQQPPLAASSAGFASSGQPSTPW